MTPGQRSALDWNAMRVRAWSAGRVNKLAQMIQADLTGLALMIGCADRQQITLFKQGHTRGKLNGSHALMLEMMEQFPSTALARAPVKNLPLNAGAGLAAVLETVRQIAAGESEDPQKQATEALQALEAHRLT